jgi:hypothetical protein
MTIRIDYWFCIFFGFIFSVWNLNAYSGVTQEDENQKLITLGAFIDTYYAYDFNRPTPYNRTVINPTTDPFVFYSTQPARSNEFNINLAFLEAILSSPKMRGRLALQAGTSVNTTYPNEPTAGIVAGPRLARNIQEAVIGYQPFKDFWIDGGAYLSHLGYESFISQKNWAYTRSLVSDNTPYFHTGIRISYAFSSELSGQFHIINGWQNISGGNAQKAVGTQLQYRMNSIFTLIHNSFFGYESGSRIFNELIFRADVTDRLQTFLELSLGLQENLNLHTTYPWYIITWVGHYRFYPKLSLATRIERYLDSHSSSIIIPLDKVFNVWGGSIGLDFELEPKLHWRNELRTFLGSDTIFQRQDGLSNSDTFLVTSLSLTF